MPTGPLYGPSKIGLEQLPGVRRTAAETPLSEGAGVDLAQSVPRQNARFCSLNGGATYFSKPASMFAGELVMAGPLGTL